MTFLLSLELLSIPKDNFPMMTKVSDPINFICLKTVAVIRVNWGVELNEGCR